MRKTSKHQTLNKIHLLGLSALLLLPTLMVARASAQTASELRRQSSSLQQQINDNLAQADNLAIEVDTLENRVAALDLEIQTAANEIAQTEQKINELTASITETEAEIERQKVILKTNLVEMYKQSGSSSVELLFSSEDFATYVNNQEYLSTIKDGVKTSVDTIIAKKKQLELDKAEQQKQKTSLEERKKNIEATRAERAILLEQTKGQESEYRRVVGDLQEQQKAINAQIARMSTSISYAGTGSYPWAGVAEGYWTAWDCYGSDPWGMCYRQCVSYTAWKVASTGRFMPTTWVNGKGNAKNWVPSAIEDGIPVFRVPQAGDVAITTSGFYGHAMYVEEVYGNGTMRVSQYNLNFDGRYSEMVMTTSRWDLYFVRFP
jgi:peptidoglycan DL-endopeptidase CwlO